MYPHLTEEEKINYFHSLMRGDALQTFTNISSPQKAKLDDIITIYRRRFVGPKSKASARNKWQTLMFEPSKQKLHDFLDELQKLARDAFGSEAPKILDQFIYAKMPPHLKRTINLAYLENGTYDQIVQHLERELELNGLGTPDDHPLPILNNIGQQPEKEQNDKKKGLCFHCAKPGHHKAQCRKLKRRTTTKTRQYMMTI